MQRHSAVVRAIRISALIVMVVSAFGCARGEPGRPAPDPTSRRTLSSGVVVGFQGRYGSHVWLGMPYAAPPVGVLRWRAPLPPQPWAGTREALQLGSACTQYASVFGGVTDARPGTPVGSEDCLYLNVYAPRFNESAVPTAAARLPVMLWIHGGGNTIGEAGFYDGGNLAATQNVVVVAVNYRLGPFGWLRHSALRNDGADELDAAGNFGTLDLVRALHWVRENIAAFGGDPDNVTIFGESAGGVNVYTLLLSPVAHGLFHRAVVQSGGLFMSTVTQAEHFTDDPESGATNSSAEMVARLLVQDGTARDRASAKARLQAMNAEEAAGYLRRKSTFEILGAYQPMSGAGMIDMPLVFREGTVLPVEDPRQRLAQAGGYNQVPVMIGTNRDENKLFMAADPALVRRILWIFPRVRDERRYNLSSEYLAKMWKATGADEPAAAMRAVQGPSVYVYRFDWDEEPTVLGADLSVMLGAAHAFEIPFVFGHFDLGRAGNMIFSEANAAGRQVLSTQMMSYWTEFAYRGAPGRGRDGQLLEWTPWDDRAPSRPKFIVFDTPAAGGLRMANDALTRAAVLSAVDADPRLPTQRDKCAIFHDLARWSRGLPKEDYPTAGARGCADYPFDQYPWES
jgi:para-nitrobenzyl esterase